MAPPTQLISVEFALGAVLCWGASDFIGGYASRRANSFTLTTIVHASGAVFMTAVALLQHAPLPSRASLAWASAAGLAGGSALAIFYRALAEGGMGLVAPISAVLAAGIPTVLTIITEGVPGVVPLLGFLLAAVGIWLISRPDEDAPSGHVLPAILCGLAFAVFFICTQQAGTGSAAWIAVMSRLVSLLVTAIATLFTQDRQVERSSAALAVLAGCLDITGSVAYVRASQTGRLDVAVVTSSLYPVVTVLLALALLGERFSGWKSIGILACLLAVPFVAM